MQPEPVGTILERTLNGSGAHHDGGAETRLADSLQGRPRHLPDLLRLFEREEARENPDVTVPLNALTMTDTGLIQVPQVGRFAFSDWSKRQAANLLGIRWDGSLYERLNPKDRFTHTLAAITAWIRAESILQPVVLHLEDAQWADDDALRVIQALTRVGADGSAPQAAASSPIAIICTARTRDDGMAFRIPVSPDIPVVEIPLGPLTAEQIGRVADNAAGRRVPDIFRAMLTEHPRRLDHRPVLGDQPLGAVVGVCMEVP